ncbi:hypothetical protein ACWDUL_20910 [Nocardia niigatensis]
MHASEFDMMTDQARAVTRAGLGAAVSLLRRARASDSRRGGWSTLGPEPVPGRRARRGRSRVHHPRVAAGRPRRAQPRTSADHWAASAAEAARRPHRTPMRRAQQPRAKVPPQGPLRTLDAGIREYHRALRVYDQQLRVAPSSSSSPSMRNQLAAINARHDRLTRTIATDRHLSSLRRVQATRALQSAKVVPGRDLPASTFPIALGARLGLAWRKVTRQAAPICAPTARHRSATDRRVRAGTGVGPLTPAATRARTYTAGQNAAVMGLREAQIKASELFDHAARVQILARARVAAKAAGLTMPQIRRELATAHVNGKVWTRFTHQRPTVSEPVVVRAYHPTATDAASWLTRATTTSERHAEPGTRYSVTVTDRTSATTLFAHKGDIMFPTRVREWAARATEAAARATASSRPHATPRTTPATSRQVSLRQISANVAVHLGAARHRLHILGRDVSVRAGRVRDLTARRIRAAIAPPRARATAKARAHTNPGHTNRSRPRTTAGSGLAKTIHPDARFGVFIRQCKGPHSPKSTTRHSSHATALEASRWAAHFVTHAGCSADPATKYSIEVTDRLRGERVFASGPSAKTPGRIHAWANALSAAATTATPKATTKPAASAKPRATMRARAR